MNINKNWSALKFAKEILMRRITNKASGIDEQQAQRFEIYQSKLTEREQMRIYNTAEIFSQPLRLN